MTPTIGLEVHAELKTKTKMFCACPNLFASESENQKPNTRVCPVCLGLPGALPVSNEKAVEMTLMIARALKSKVTKVSKWDRKNYFYPDLPKGYQISQYDLPLATRGFLKLPDGGEIAITRVHLEEDTGKLLHPSGTDYSLIDFNRCGVPLVELVSDPVITSAQQAKLFAQEYQLILRYLGVSDADMEKGQMRVEANVSVRATPLRITNKPNNESSHGLNKDIRYSHRFAIRDGLGTKVEIKNLNSFRSVERAIEYEIERQTKLLEAGEKIVQETRGWDETKQVTIAQRTKETSSDYRYFPEPDIPPIQISNLKAQISKLPELPSQKRQKLAKLGIKGEDIDVLVGDLARMRKFEAVKGNQAIANLLVHKPETARLSNSELVELANLPAYLQKAKLSGAKIGQVMGEQELKAVISAVLKEEVKAVSDIKAGKSQAIGVLIGQVMAKTRGGADPAQVKALVEKML